MAQKFNNIAFFAVLFLVCSLAVGKLSAQIIHLAPANNQYSILNSDENGFEATLQINNISFHPVSTPQGTYYRLSPEGFGVSHQQGKPELPVYYALIAIPHNADIISSFDSSETRLINLALQGINGKIIPVQPPVAKSDKNPQSFIIDNQTYTSESYFSEPLISVEDLGIMRGIRIARLAISPFRYNPLSNELEIIQNITIKIRFSGGDAAYSRNEYIKTFSPHFENVFAKLQNHQWFTNQTTKDSLSRHPMKYVIIADSMFLQTMQPFVQWKTKQGFKVVEIYASGITTSSITTIRSALTTMYQSATASDPAPTYILLVGDIAQMPAFTGTIIATKPSDLPFAEYTNDFLPEAYFGRFSAETVTDLQNILHKTLMHDQYTFPDPAFLANSVLIAGHDNAYGPLHANGQINYATNYYFNASNNIIPWVYLYPTSSQLASQIRQKISAGASLVNYTAHAGISGWADPAFNNSHVSSMTNAGKYPVMIGNACLSNKFSAAVCFGEALTRASQKGAVAYIGASENTFWNEDFYWAVGAGTPTANPLYDSTGLGVYDCLFHTNGEPYSRWHTTTGQMIFAGNLAVMSKASTNYSNYYWEAYHVMGDPSLMPYLGIPSPQTATFNPIVVNLNIFSVQTTPYALVALSAQGVLHGSAIADSTGMATLSIIPFTGPGTADLIITAQNKQPYSSTVNAIIPNIPFILYHEHTVNDANNNGKAEYDETVMIDISMRNFTHLSTSGVNSVLRSNDPNITITDSIANFGAFAAFDTIALSNAFAFKVNPIIPDNHLVIFELFTTDSVGNFWTSNFSVKLHTPVIELSHFIIDDVSGGNGNFNPDPSENIIMKFIIKNTGSADIDSLNFSIQSLNPNYTFSGSPLINELKNKANDTVQFQLYVSPSATIGELASFSLTAQSGFISKSKTYTIMTGTLMEDFESGDFSKYPWQHSGDSSWKIVDTTVFQGTYSAISGQIGNNQKSELVISMHVVGNDSIRFHYKVSSELDYDELRFFINNDRVGAWSGETGWQYAAFAVEPGFTTFTWQYSKDYYVEDGSDCAMLDNIIFPGSDLKSEIPKETKPDIGQIIIYPNPAQSSVNVRLDAATIDFKGFEIYDLSGRRVLYGIASETDNESSNLSIDISSLSKGFYIIKVTGSQQFISKPFIKN